MTVDPIVGKYSWLRVCFHCGKLYKDKADYCPYCFTRNPNKNKLDSGKVKKFDDVEKAIKWLKE